MKTDLTKILSVPGQPGLFRYVAQARNGAVVESLADGKRSSFGVNNRISALSDISIYADDGEVKLQEVFEKMKAGLGDADAPSPKASADELKDFFAGVLPGYDRDRFYVSHMKKVAGWYNCLKQYASLDFEAPEQDAAGEGSDAAGAETEEGK